MPNVIIGRHDILEKMGKRGPKPKGRVDTTWRPELAYAVGLLAADGSLSKNRRHIDFTSSDRELVETYSDCLGLSGIRVGTKKGGNQKEYCRMQFGDVLFYEWLTQIGFTANKSLTICSIDLPHEFFFDFLRGVWDGDGTITCSRDKRWKNSYVVSIGFASGSKKFLEWVQCEINTRLGTTGHIHQGARVLQLRYARNDSQKIFDAMFYKKNVPHLERKFAKAQKIFKIIRLS